MSWAEIKTAINSSLGTEDFEPLDKKIERLFTQEYHLISSDDIYYTFPVANVTNDITLATNLFTFPYKFVATRNGYLSLVGGIGGYTSAQEHSNGHYFIVRSNGQEVQKISLGTFLHNYGSTKINVPRIDLSIGNEYSFEIEINLKYGQSYNGWVNFKGDDSDAWSLKGKPVVSGIQVE